MKNILNKLTDFGASAVDWFKAQNKKTRTGIYIGTAVIIVGLIAPI